MQFTLCCIMFYYYYFFPQNILYFSFFLCFIKLINAQVVSKWGKLHIQQKKKVKNCNVKLKERKKNGKNLLTFDTKWKLITNSFTFSIYCTAGIITGRVLCDFLQYKALVWPDDTCCGIMSQHYILQLKCDYH